MIALLLPLLLARDVMDVPLVLDKLTADEAKAIDGQTVRACFEVGKPVFTWNGKTVLGCEDHADEVERTAVLNAERHDIDPGDKMTVVGVVRLLRHKESVVNGTKVPAWVEIRVVELD